MSRADDDSDDEGLEGLGSFRAMFRELPDEEPPQRGLAELMAAARVKAEEMAKPSLWERFLQTMRRPQVMALATIMILIGGAVFISQRQSDMDASPTATQSEENAASQTVATGAPGAPGPSGAGSGMEFGTAERQDIDKKADGEAMIGGAADQGAPPSADPTMDVQRQRAGDTDLLSKGRSTRTAETKEEATGNAPVRRMDTKAPPKAAKPSPTNSPAKPAASGKSGDLMFEGAFDDDVSAGPPSGATAGGTAGGGTKTGAAAPSPPPPPPAPAPTEAMPESEKPAATTTPPPATNKQQQLTVQQLHANAKKLATAGDCAQVRTIAKQIAAKDPKYYRDNIAPDASLAGCLK